MQVFTDREIIYSNADDDTKKAVIGTGLATASALALALASKQKPKSDIQQKCGKRPLFGKQKKQDYQNCINSGDNQMINASNKSTMSPPTSIEVTKNVKIALVVGCIIVAGFVGYFIYKRNKK